jgi:hypothetical protein
MLGDVFSRPWAEDFDDYARYKAMAVKARERYRRHGFRLKMKAMAADRLSREVTLPPKGSSGMKKLVKLLGQEVDTPGPSAWFSTGSTGPDSDYLERSAKQMSERNHVSAPAAHGIWGNGILPLSDEERDNLTPGLKYRPSIFRSHTKLFPSTHGGSQIE